MFRGSVGPINQSSTFVAGIEASGTGLSPMRRSGYSKETEDGACCAHARRRRVPLSHGKIIFFFPYLLFLILRICLDHKKSCGIYMVKKNES